MAWYVKFVNSGHREGGTKQELYANLTGHATDRKDQRAVFSTQEAANGFIQQANAQHPLQLGSTQMVAVQE